MTHAALAHANTSQASVRLPRIVADYEIAAASQDAATVLWQNARLSSASATPAPSTAQVQQSLRAVIVADPVLGEAYQWRQLLRGNSARQWKLAETSAGEMHLKLGAHTLPVMQLSGVRGSRAAAGVAGKSFGFYSTRPMQLLNNSLQAADEVLGEAVSHDASELNWFSARPFQTQRGTVDVVFLHGQNDLRPHSATKVDSQFRRGAMAGAKVAYTLPSRWKLDGELMSGRMEDAEGGEAVIVALAGPVRHPLGEAGVRFSYRDIGSDFSSFAGRPADAGFTTRQLSVQQPFKSGDVSGSLGVQFSERTLQEEATLESAALPTLPAESSMLATSNIRWQATPAVALSASHEEGSGLIERDVVANQSLSQITTERQNRRSRVGMEWRLMPGLSIAADGGETRFDQRTASDRLLSDLSNRDNHFSLALQSQSPTTQMHLKLERRIALDLNRGAGNVTDAVSLGANRRIAPWLQFGGTVRLAETEHTASGLEVPASDVTAHTTLSLRDLGQLRLRYTHSSSTLSDGVRLNGETSASTVGVSYILGAQNGAGLGLLVDYSRREGTHPNREHWRLGITYR